jgi:hypothetical protein
MRTDFVLGMTVTGIRTGASVGRLALAPARLATRAPVMRRMADDIAHEGALVRLRIEAATADLLADRLVTTVLEHELTERAMERALASPGLDRLVVKVLDSRFVDELTERVLHSPEMDRVVQYVATSPQVIEAVTQHTQTLAEEMVEDVRRRSQTVDDLAERAVRGWLRRPRPAT